jgi:Ca-activated chloride channel homolog
MDRRLLERFGRDRAHVLAGLNPAPALTTSPGLANVVREGNFPESRFMRCAARLLAAFLLIFTATLPLRAADEGARVILVLDASGSMWGQIDGKPKMQIAKEVVGKVVGNWKETDELGLVAYGHREKGSCEDIQVLIEPGKLDKDAYLKAVKGLNAKGKTPMTAAVKMAAESLKFTEKKATVILVSDGIETCGVDPCAIASELEKLGVGLTVHTVGFNIDDPAAKDQLKCLAENTGGIATTAENADELEEKLNETITVTETKPEEPPPPPTPPAAPEFNVTGHVVQAEGVELGAPYTSPTWEVHAANSDGSKGAYVLTEYGFEIKTKLKPGDYIVSVTSDVATVSFPQTVGAEPVKLEPSLEAGILRIAGKQDANTDLSVSAAWEIANAAGQYITTKYGPKTEFMLNAGAYKVKLTLGAASMQQDFAVAAGKTQDAVMVLGAGVIEVSAKYAEAGPDVEGDSMAVEIRKGAPSSDGSYEWITTSYGAVTRYDLPAGKYRVVATRDYATASAEAEVKAGETVRIKINLNAGFLSVKAANAANIQVFSAEKSISGERKNIAYEYTAELNKAFPAGTYHVMAQDSGGQTIGEKDIEVKAGARAEASIP